ncbi:nucleophile aminohydrolase [Xylaria bambusicola]|uniref:nucleophile aminohydrolase n=1 Tax=Xylaria bambusicola TaxID=326684 RepID=UPI002008009B|nr:nucleophile aminohydrolase [Xylaria bambusicola]KAI0505298.1 nucleophile aminohydrolase [Xylaria bambusicola]
MAGTTSGPSHSTAGKAVSLQDIGDVDGSETSSDDDSMFAVDGAADRVSKRWGKPVTAIFIHAGAGYHSTANEEHHLKACSEAARVGMKALKAGRPATEAAEAALVVLENKEITNAGYGSNLAIDGTVECDATIVDHFGRSGACGAVPNVKNPISLARMILESSNKPLSLRRVPPNLLVCEGARDFARDSGMMLVGNDDLISKNARDRFVRWRDDMRRAESHDIQAMATSRSEMVPQYDQDPRKEHTKALLTGTWNEGQPDSPTSASPWLSPQNRQSPVPTTQSTETAQISPKPTPERSPLSFLGASLPYKRHRFLPPHSDEYTDGCMSPGRSSIPSHDGASDEVDPIAPIPYGLRRSNVSQLANSEYAINMGRDDHITDTVGAIAIDQLGHIAAGSSSGGIGMKHRGRIGPAALVGVGTAVVPADSRDADAVTVAAVTSGTGEHMATTMASQRCAERLYHGSVRGADGRDVPEDDENAILESFILNDFLGHPGVRESTSTGAIGVMAVKKTPGGYYLYFGHNTESFALASMGSNDQSPSCTMSRINDGGSPIAQGARKIFI